MKHCARCKKEKEITEFHHDKVSWCKKCDNAYKRERYAANKPKFVALSQDYYWRNKETIQKKNAIRNQKNRDKKREYNQQYYAKNRDKIVKSVIQYELERKKTDPAYRALRNLRQRVRSVLKEKAFSKRTEQMLGLTQSEFKKYIESLFEEGMTWDNYGYRGWHLDHSKAISTANTIEEMEALCHYTNLKPMWGVENMRKGARS